nr:MAG TPA: hypothetical protein [Caudoviricetes sp.]
MQSCSPARTAARWSATGWRRREFHRQGGRQGSRPLYPSIHTGSGQGGLLPGRPASGLRGLGRPEGLCHASVRR